MALTVADLPKKSEVEWRNAVRGQMYRCTENVYLVLCKQEKQAVALNTADGAKVLGDTWSPGPNSRWISVNATLTVIGDE